MFKNSVAKLPLNAVPAATNATATMPAMIAYSIALTPCSSRTNALKNFDILFPRTSDEEVGRGTPWHDDWRPATAIGNRTKLASAAQVSA